MIKITFVLPQKSDTELALKTFQEHDMSSHEEGEETMKYNICVIHTLQPRQVIPQLLDSDIIVARGVIALTIKKCLPYMTVVEIPTSGQDIISTIYCTVQKQGNVLMGVIGSSNMVLSTLNIAGYLGAKIKHYVFEQNTEEEIATCLSTAIEEGCKAIIGGIDICEYAEKKGMPAYPLPISRESIWQAISEAKHSALIRNQERAKALQFQTILDYAYEGIIATDNKGRVITFNKSAAKILGIPAEKVIDHFPSNALADARLSIILSNAKEYSQEIIPFQKHHLSLNKIKMNLNGECIGNIVTFQDVASIQKAESIIRDKIYARGHVAKYSFTDIIGDSHILHEVINTAKVYAEVHSNILILGESGTGKELFAQSIHNASRRRNGPFVAVNCAALAKSLLESELFGYVEGAFTGASKAGKPGLFELASGGTIFLDEISELPVDLQGRLLRVIQEREIMRLGDDRIIPVDVRIISASNKPLPEQVKNGEFRQDLYYRLNVLTIKIPPLRDRKEDILGLVNHFLKNNEQNFSKKPIILSSEAEQFLYQLDWAGNVREIRNICERLLSLNQTGVITKDDVRRALPEEMNLLPSSCLSTLNTPEKVLFKEKARQQEKENILKVLVTCGYDKNIAAQMLGYSRTTLWRRMKDLDIPFSQ